MERILADNWGVLASAPIAFVAALRFGVIVGWIVVGLIYNQRLTHYQELIANYRDVLDDKLPPRALRPFPRKRSKQMSFGLVLIFVGIVAAFVGALILALEKSGQQPKLATAAGPVASSSAAAVTQNPIPPASSPVPAVSSSSMTTIESLSQDQRASLARDLYKLKSSIPVIFLTESGVQPPSHDRSVFVGLFQKAGIQPGTTFQEVEGPDQTGLLLCVPDVNAIPDKVKQLAEVLRKYGIETSYAPLIQTRISSTIPPEVGFVLFVGPKS